MNRNYQEKSFILALMIGFIAMLLCGNRLSAQSRVSNPYKTRGNVNVVAANATGLKDNDPGITSPGYTSKWDTKPFDHKIFVENKGQFTTETGRAGDRILYEAKLGKVKAYFLPNGIVYRKEGWFLEDEAEKEKEEMERARDRDKGIYEKIPVQFQRMNWVDANPDPEVIAEDPLPYPYIYGVGMDQSISVSVYRRIVYRNLYPGIDVEYVFPEGDKDGFKYNVILHPGADLNTLKMKFPGASGIVRTKEGDAVIKTNMEEFTDHAPISFSEDGKKVDIQFHINGNEIAFQCLEALDNSQKITIDPWTTNPAFAGSYNHAYDIDYDNAGNVLVYGGWSPAQLVKLNSAGAIQWKYNANTINTDPDAQWGDFCVDKVTGRSYIIEGFNPTPTGARSLKISAAGALVATFAGNANFEEMDRVAYNECTRRLVIGGGGTNATNQGCILDTNMTGFTPRNVLGANLPFHDMWLLAMDPSGTTCYMGSTESCCNPNATYDNRLLKLNVPALTASTFNFNSRTAFNTWMPEGVSNVLYMTWSGVPANGYNGLTCSKNFLYFYDGVDLRKLNKNTGAQIVARTNVGNSMQSYGGIDVDVCDNVYVGRNSSRIFVFNGNTLAAASAPTSTLVCTGAVYDLVLGKNYNEVYACGNGFVQAFTIASPPITFTNTSTNPTCGSCNGSITANLYECGVATAATYLWSDGQTTQTATNLCAGTYTVVVTPTTECRSYTSVITLTAAGALTPTITAAPGTICNGSSTVLTASGATTYTWSANAGGATTNTVSVSPGGTTVYTVTGTSGACSGSQTFTVNVNAAPTLTIAATSTTICNGSSAVISASGATTYTWTTSTGLSNPNAANPTASPTATTVYTVTGTSAGCNSAPATVTVNVTPLPTLTTTATSNTVCAGGTATLTASGASTYTWSPSGTLSSANGSPVVATPTATTTNYTVTGTQAGCNGTSVVTVSVNPTPSLTVTPSPATICSGTSTTITASGASTYTWSANAGGATTSTVVVTPTITTTYTVNATGANTCPGTRTVTVNVNTAPTLTLAANSYTICNGNSTSITASGATTYTWTTGTGLNCTVCQTPTASPSGTTVYTVTGTSGSCNSTPLTVTVNVTPIPTLTLSATSNTLCTGGTATLTATGASTFTWSPSGTLSSPNGSPVVATPTASTTNYTVTGTQAGCNGSSVISVSVNPTPTINISPSSATVCPTGTATLTASGASTYTWSPASTLNTSTGATVISTPTASTIYTVTGTSAAGCPNTNTVSVAVNATISVNVNSPTACSGTGVVLSASGASSYTWSPAGGLSSTTGATVTATPTTTTQYTVTGNSAGCTGSNTSTVTINPLPTLTVSATSSSICSGNSTTLTVNGANTYTWSPSGSLSSPNGTPVVASPTAMTTYTVIGTDANGCQDVTQIFVDVSAPPSITATPTTICSGQSSVLSASGASSYTWSANAGSVNTSTASVNPTSTTIYTVVGTVGTCTSQATTTVNVNTTPTLTLSSNTYTICNGNSTAITAGGATTYTWTTGTGLSCTTCQTPTANPTSTTIYTVTGTDAGCQSAPETVTVTVNALPNITATPSSSNICSSGSATLTANGGTTYTWSPAGDLSSANGSPVTATPTASATYTVTGTDANGCQNSNTVSITVDPTPVINITPVPAAVCAGQTVILTGGTATTYTWSSNAGGVNTSTTSVTPSATDTYTLTGGIGSCTASATVTVPVNPLPVITNSTVTSAPCGQNTGCIDTVMVTSGTPTYTYSYNGGAGSTSPQFCGQPAGNYNLVVTDANGCMAALVINIPSQNGPQPPSVTASATSVCVGGTVSLSVTPTVPGIVYTWTDINGTTTGSTYTVTNINPPGTYTIAVTATDTALNCSNITNTSVTVTPTPTLAVIATNTVICSGQSVVLTASGATTYTWSANAGSANTNTVSVNPTSNTTYTVNGGSNGCNDQQTINVNVNPTPTVAIAASSNNICSGQSAVLTASGATTFTWMPGNATSTTLTVTPNATSSYTLTGDSLGCTSAQQVVTVNVTQTPTLTATPSSATVCSTQSATITVSGATTYTWFPSGSGSPIVVTPTGNTTYTVIGGTGNCSDTTTVSIGVIPSPTLNITAGGTGTAVCAGTTATLTASGATNYTWQPSGATGTTFTDTPTGTTTYTVTGDNGGCPGSQQITINVNQLPTLTTSNGNQAVCSGSPVSTISYTTNGTVVNWTNTNGNIGIATSGSGTINGYTAPIVTQQEMGIITATPFDSGTGCTGIAQDYTVTVYPLPTATGGLTDSAKCGATNGGIHDVNVSGGTPGYTYQWYNSGGVMPGETDSTLSNTSAGNYTLVVTDLNGCQTAAGTGAFTIGGSSAVVTTITPVLSQGTGSLSVTFDDTTSGGATIFSWNFGNGQFSSQQTNGPISYNAPGTYTVTFYTSNGGCADTATALVIIDAPTGITVPNIFSPNGDGINDNWFITSSGYCELHAEIYNRWGQLVYQLLGVNDVWNGIMNNGNPASEGTYYYIIEAKSCLDGKAYKVSGYMTLVK